MERGEWEDNSEYPNAPLPAHERTWRHPSEQGATQWVQSEPPLVVGRGLSVATGTVGAVLAVGLLWLMIPHDNRGGGVAVQASTTVRLAAEPFSSRATTTLVATVPAELASAPVTSLAPGITVKPAPATTTSSPGPASSFAQPATTPESGAPGASSPATDPAPAVETATRPAMALAVSVGPVHFVAATAAAVGDRSTMTVQLPSGDSTEASVVSVDTATGIAVLALPDGVTTNPIKPSQAAIPTDSAVVMTPAPMPVSVWRDDTGTNLTFDPNLSVPEGSLVLDTDNRLIGMCTATATGVHVLDATALLDAINAAIARMSPVWLGLHVEVAPNGDLTVVEVGANSPSAAVGIQIGSLIRAIDGKVIQGADGLAVLRSNIRAHLPGDAVTLSVIAPGAADPTDVAVTLVANSGAF